MVKLGFVVEGEATKVILESESFKLLLASIGVDYVPKIIDAGSNGNFLPHNRTGYVSELKAQGANRILFLLDKEDQPCYTSVRERVQAEKDQIVVVASKAFEAWYLADDNSMSSLLKKKYNCANPEDSAQQPHIIIQSELKSCGQPGTGPSKIKFARRMIRSGFSIENAAKNENCPSAKYLLAKLHEVAQQ